MFLADENFDGPSVRLLRSSGLDVIWMAESGRGLPDRDVIGISNADGRTVLTHDSDFGELIFKHGLRPTGGVVYFRIPDFSPGEPAAILLELIGTGRDLTSRLTVIDRKYIRERGY